MDFAKIIRMIDTNSSKQTLNEGWEDMMKANKEKAKEKGTDKFDKKETSTGTVHTRKSSTFSDGGDDKDTKKAKEKAKNSKVKEGDDTDLDEGLGDMASKVGGAIKNAVGRVTGQTTKPQNPNPLKVARGPEGAQHRDEVRAQQQEYDRLSMGDRYGESMDKDVDEGLGDMVNQGIQAAKKVGNAAKKVGNAALDTLGHGNDDELIRRMQMNAGLPQTGKKPAPAPEQMSKETVEEDDIEEGGKFSGALNAARKAGEEEFEVDGKKYKVRESVNEESKTKLPSMSQIKKMCQDGMSVAEICKKHSDCDQKELKQMVADCKKKMDEGKKAKPDFLDMDKDGNKTEPMKKAAKEKKKVDEAMSECYDQAMDRAEQESGINVSSNMDTKTGNQTLTITAQGSSADELAQLLKLSGILGGGHSAPQEVDIAMEEGEYANVPHEQVQGVASQLQQGNDLNRPKKTYPRVAGGDNPMQAAAAMESRANAAIAEIEKRLMEQLDAIKVAAPKAKYENSYNKPTAVKQKK